MAITFAAAFIDYTGVRLILAEIVPAFTGFQKNWANARPALWTAPVVYPMPLTRCVGTTVRFSRRAGGAVAGRVTC